MPPTREEWQSLAQKNGELLAQIAKDKPEWVERIVASIERCNVEAARSQPAQLTKDNS